VRSLLLLPALATLAALTPSCAEEDPTAAHNDAGDEAFVRRLVPLMWGRTATSVNEVSVLVDVLAASDREQLVRAMARSPEFVDAWQANLMDMTGVNRVGARANRGCYAESAGQADGPELARFVATHGARRDFGSPWTMRDLARSAILADDLSPWFEADLFAHLVWDNPVMNILETEAIRTNLAELFQRNYLHREMSCLPCHNSEASVTGSDDPEKDRTWEVPGYFEAALFGASEGEPLSRLHGYFRRDGVIVGPTQGTDEEDQPDYDPQVTTPWGGVEICGEWGVPEDIRADRLGLDAFFVHDAGDTPSIWDLEPLLRDGLDHLRGGELPGGVDAEVDGADAFAGLLALSVGEKVWIEAFGFGLTLSHGFPRNQAQRDLLIHLANTWLGGDFSLVDVLVEVATHPYFSQNAPRDVVESDTAYFLEPVFAPFAAEDEDPVRRSNSTADQVRRRSSRALLRSAYTALQWPPLPEFPVGVPGDLGRIAYEDDAWVQQVLGLSVKDSASGFRTLDFQTLLAWESWFGACTNPLGEGADDWVDRLLAAGVADGATAADVLSALKDRLLADPDLGDAGERAVLEDVLGAPLDARVEGPALGEIGPAVRRVCGLWLSSPQFQLGGLPSPARAGTSPALTVPGSSWRDACDAVADAMFGGGGLACRDDGLELR
jgi:hypothetical protein